MNQLINAVPDLSCQWRDRKGIMHNPADMTTRHLFFTLRMVWNHAAPPRLRFMPYIRYRFPAFYNTEYMLKIIPCLFNELVTREDRTAEMLQTLDAMAKRFNEFKWFLLNAK